MSSSPPKRSMTGIPASPGRSPSGRCPKWDVDRLSPRHRVFKTNIASMSASGKFTRWMEEIEASFNPSLFQSSNQGPGPSTPRQAARPSSESRLIQSAVSRRPIPTKSESHQAQLDAFRRERRQGSQIDPHRALAEDRLPKIGEDDMDCVGIRPKKSQDSGATSITSKKRDAAEALDEPMPLVTEDANTASTQPGKRQRSNRRGFTSARSSSSSSFSAKSFSSNSNYSSATSPSISKPLPTPRELEKMDSKQHRPSPKLWRVTKPDQMTNHTHSVEGLLTDVWHTWLAGLPSAGLERKIGSTAEKLKGLELEDLVCRAHVGSTIHR
ncbi:MAG: hypothetical protein Q9172_005429 [Xanthocarpia lactea]